MQFTTAHDGERKLSFSCPVVLFTEVWSLCELDIKPSAKVGQFDVIQVSLDCIEEYPISLGITAFAMTPGIHSDDRRLSTRKLPVTISIRFLVWTLLGMSKPTFYFRHAHLLVNT
jgi:hypothetical protein